MRVDDVLAFERAWLNRDRTTGAYAAAVRERFDMSLTAYTLVLLQVLDSPEAAALDPVTVRVLTGRRRRGSKQRRERLGGSRR